MLKNENESVISCLFDVCFVVVIVLCLLVFVCFEAQQARLMRATFESFVFDENVVDVLVPKAR